MDSLPVNDEILARRTLFLKKVRLFSGLEEQDLRELAGNLRSRKYRKKEIIFHQGDDSHVIYVVKTGKVRIFMISPDGNETSVTILSTYDMIGEFAAIDGRPRSATAQTMEETTLLEMDRGRFLDLLQQRPGLAINLLRMLVGKLRWTTKYAETIAQYDITGRLLYFLLHYNEMLGKEIEAGKQYELHLSMTQEDLASLVGARREWVNRILKEWGKQGLLEFKRGVIRILNLPALEKKRENLAMDIDQDW